MFQVKFICKILPGMTSYEGRLEATNGNGWLLVFGAEIRVQVSYLVEDFSEQIVHSLFLLPTSRIMLALWHLKTLFIFACFSITSISY